MSILTVLLFFVICMESIVFIIICISYNKANREGASNVRRRMAAEAEATKYRTMAERLGRELELHRLFGDGSNQ